MSATRILYYGGLWPTNMGNSFIDLGARHLLEKAYPASIVFQSSRFSRFYAQHRHSRSIPFLRNDWEPFDLAGFADVDFVVVAGNVTHTDFIHIEGQTIRELVNRGAKLIILGGGCSTYDRDEFHAFKEFMHSVRPLIFVSRDSTSYSELNGCSEYDFRGIDCGFFVSDAVRPTPVTFHDYVVCSFDDQEKEDELGLGDRRVVRTRHYSFGIREQLKKKLNNTVVSDSPNDYLSLYAQAEAVYSDRVHACVAAISYGRPARLISGTPRAKLFAEVGAEAVTNTLTHGAPDLLLSRKQELIEFLQSVNL